MDDREESSPASGWIAIGLLLLVSALALARTRAPAARGADAPEREYSAVRALASLRRVLGDEAPHPLGSAAHALVRERLLARLADLELAPQVEESLVQGRNGVVAVVRNVVATVPGTGAGPGLLLAAHYDSVAAGPGAGDDGSGVASLLEIARALRAEPIACPATLLFTDGEEAGLLGAEAFTARHEVAREFRAVVNLEARGTDGPCYLFETSRGNEALVGSYALAAARPSASSFAQAIYERMPNDTDLTALKRGGIPAANFAFIGGLRRYHTPLDDLAHLSPGSVQHQGEQALALVRALALAPGEPAITAGDAVYTDVLGFALVRWRARWAVPLAVAALALLVFAARRGVRRGIFRGALLAAAAIALGALAGAALVGGIELARGPEPWAGHPVPATAALVAGAAAGLAALARVPFFSRVGFAATWAGAWLLLALAGLAAAVLAPGVTALLLPPVLAAGLAGFLRRPLLRAAAPLLVLAALWVPLAAGLAAVAELRAPAVLGAVVGVVLAAATPALRLLGTRDLARCAQLAAGTAAIAAVAALLVPSHTVDRPAWLNLVHLEDADAGTARVLANAFGGPLPDALARAADFSETPESPLPGLSGLAAAAEPAPASPPSVEIRSEVVEDGARTIELHLGSTRGARGLVVSARELEAPDEHDSGVLRAAWNGHAIDRPRPRVGAVRGTRASGTWVFLGTGAEGIDLRLRAPKDERAELSVIDFASGLPETCRELARARPATSVPRGEGDLSLVARRIEL